MPMTLGALKRGLVLFWTIWFTLALATNIFEGLKALGIVRRSWPFASGNYALVESVQSKYPSPPWLGGVLFAGVVLGEAVATWQFWRAFGSYGGRAKENLAQVNSAFGTSIGLWAAFMVMDEFFVAYETGVEATHTRIFTAELATLLSLHLLPD